jgi:hypothetical protein
VEHRQPEHIASRARNRNGGSFITGEDSKDRGKNSQRVEGAFRTAINTRAEALMLAGGGFFGANRKPIVELAPKNRLPATYPNSQFVESGGLMPYTEDRTYMFRRAAEYVDKILKGAKPAAAGRAAQQSGGAMAQQTGKVYRIGFLFAGNSDAVASRFTAFREGLKERGYLEGKTIVIESRYGHGNSDRVAALATELVNLKVDVIVTVGPTDTRAAKENTTIVPIVMAQDSDPVGSGFVASLARPGGEYHRPVHTFPRDQWKIVGASQGGCSRACARGCYRQLDRARQQR